MHIVATILVIENLSIARHQYRYGIGEQHHAGRQSSGRTIEPLVTDAKVLEIHGVHQVMQRDVGIASAEPREQRRHKPAERNHGATPESTEQEIEPDDIRLETPDGADDANGTSRVIERPAAYDGVPSRLGMIRG